MQMTATRVDSDLLPAGWYVERTVRDYDDEWFVRFAIFEEGGAEWPTGEPRSALDVEMWLGGVQYGRPALPRVSWPSTSDKRPVLALALAATLRMAAEEAMD